MNTKIIAIAALSGFAAFGAHAYQGEENPLPPQQFKSMQSRASVQSEAGRGVKISNGGTGVMAVNSTTDRARVRAAAIAATRDGTANYGEM